MPDSKLTQSGARITSGKQGPRWLWWGWKGWWKRPVWFTRGILGAPHVREFGIGPISYVWSADDGLFGWRRS